MIEFILVWEFFSDSEIRDFISLDSSSKLVIIFLFIIFVWKLWKDNNLVLDGNISIDIHNSSEIYKFFQTPRNYREEIKKIKFNFIYNFDQEITNLNNIEIDNLVNPEVNNILGQFISKETILQNRIYFKTLINEAIKSYAG